MSTDAFIGAIATLMGILITFVLGFQIINALEINKKLHQFEESVEKKNKEHNEKIEKNTEITNKDFNQRITDLKTEVTTELSQFNQNVDSRIKNVEDNIENTINKIDSQLTSITELGSKLEIESLDTRSVILIDRIRKEVDINLQIQNLINVILIIGKMNELAKRASKEISWEHMEISLNLLQMQYLKIVDDINILGDANKIEGFKKDIIDLVESYNKFNEPYIKHINIIMYIIEQSSNNMNKGTLLIEVEAFIKLYRKDIDDYIANNQ